MKLHYKNRMHWSKREADAFVICGTVVLVLGSFTINNPVAVLGLAVACFTLGRWTRAQIER